MTVTGGTGVMICGHGSREAGTVREFMALSRDVALRLPQFRVASGFLEFAAPTILDGLEKLRQAGSTRILVIPGTLFAAGHSQNDIPAILQGFARQYPDVQIVYGNPFGVEPKFVAAACARVRDAIRAAPGRIAPEKTALLVAGRGASDPGALSAMETITGLIQAELNFAHIQTAYADMALPRVPDALEQIAGRSYEQVIILPYFLFSGLLVKRIYDAAGAIAGRYPGTQFVKTSYLNNHPFVIDSFVARIIETSTAGTVVNG